MSKTQVIFIGSNLLNLVQILRQHRINKVHIRLLDELIEKQFTSIKRGEIDTVLFKIEHGKLLIRDFNVSALYKEVDRETFYDALKRESEGVIDREDKQRDLINELIEIRCKQS